MSSDDGQTLVAAGCEQTYSRSIIIRSTNGGVSWNKLDLTNAGLPLSYEGITRSVMKPGSTTDFLVLLGYTAEVGQPSNPGLYRTINGGISFNKVTGIPDGVNTGSRYHEGNAFLETDGVNLDTRYLYLAAQNNAAARGFYRSTDGGSNWAKLSSQPLGTEWSKGMAVDRSVAGRIWITGGYRGIFRSDNGGDSWSAVGDFTEAASIDAAYGRIAVWGMRPGDTYNKIYYSPDNGVTWSEKTGPGHRYADLRSLAVDPNRPGQIWVSGISMNVINPPSSAVGSSIGLTPASISLGMPSNTTTAINITLENSGLDPLTWSASLPPGDGDYAVADTTYTWLDAVTGGSLVTSLEGTSVYSAIDNIPFPSGFTFPYYGSSYTSFNLSVKGWLSVGAPGSGTYHNNVNTLPTTVPSSAPPNMIAPLWNENFATGSANAGVYYKQVDADTFVITWRDVQYSTSSTARATVQAVLSRNGEIRFQYQSNTMGTGYPAGYGIYIANTDASHSTVFSSNTASAPASKAIRFTPPASWLSSVSPASSSAAGGALAAGTTRTVTLNIDTTGLTTGSTYNADVTFASNDPYKPSITLPVSITISNQPIITVGQSATGTVSSAFSYQIVASSTPTSYALASGSLPPGITLNTTTGVLSGTPTATGTFTPSFTATNTNGTSSPVAVTITLLNPSALLTGTVIGTSGSWGGSSSTVDKVFDGDLTTFFDAPTANGNWAGLDFGVGNEKIITQVRYAPRDGYTSRIVNAVIQGSNTADFSSGVVNLYTINSAPSALVLTSQAISNATAFRYARILTANDSFGNVAELQFYGTASTPPTALDTFRSTYGLTTNGSQDTATPAADGVANLLKYAFNMLGSGTGQASSLATPNASVLTPSGSAGLPFSSIEAGTGKLQLTFIRRKAASSPGITYMVEFSDDLTTWTTNPSATASATSIDSTFERVTLTDSLASPTKRFVRVRLTAP